jgi:hypothetical protein
MYGSDARRRVGFSETGGGWTGNKENSMQSALGVVGQATRRVVFSEH